MVPHLHHKTISFDVGVKIKFANYSIHAFYLYIYLHNNNKIIVSGAKKWYLSRKDQNCIIQRIRIRGTCTLIILP